MRLIDADALIPNISVKAVFGNDVTAMKCGELRTVLEMIENAPTIEPQRWIPCSERLPEEDGQYLVTVRYKHVDGYEDVYAEYGEWCNGNWDMFCFGHCGEVESILAWMPLQE